MLCQILPALIFYMLRSPTRLRNKTLLTSITLIQMAFLFILLYGAEKNYNKTSKLIYVVLRNDRLKRVVFVKISLSHLRSNL